MMTNKPRAVQLNLFSEKPTLADLYVAWKAENREVVKAFFRYADFAAKHGKKFGAGLIWERMRWDRHFATEGDEYKCNNNWRAYLMRDWIKARPHWAHLVETRKLRSMEEMECQTERRP